MDGRLETGTRWIRDSIGLLSLAGSLSLLTWQGCSGTAGDEGTVNLIAAQEAEAQNPKLAVKAAKFSGSIGVAPKPKRPSR
ncbi:hypothetical protein EP7_002669 [Isosphaeraceae bacterium EP7]